MWTRARFLLTRAAWAVAGRVGTPAVSLPLAAVLAVAGVVEGAVLRDQRSLTETRAWWILVWILLGDAVIALLRGLPYRQREDGRLAWTGVDAKAAAGLLARGAWLLLALAVLASSGWRDRMEFRVAEGERFTAALDQLVSRDPVRYGSAGPFPVDLLVERAEGGPWAPARTVGALLREPGAGELHVGRFFPSWFGWGRYLRVVGAGPTIRCVADRPGGGVIERVAARLDLSGTSRGEVRLQAAPFRVVVASQGDSPFVPGRPPALRAWVHRGKLLVGEGAVRDGGWIEADGIRVSFPEWLPWIQLEMVRDPGAPLALLAAFVGVAGLCLGLLARRQGRGTTEAT